MSYVDVFGGSPVQPSEVSYSIVTLVADAQLYWGWGDATSGVAAAGRVTDVNCDTAGFSVILPPADQASVGQDILIINQGSESFTLKRYGGTVLTTISPGSAKYLYITFNGSAPGSWSILGFGTATNTTDAGILAGKGLTALGATLNSEWPVIPSTFDYSVTSADRAGVIVFSGGNADLTLPSAVTLGTDFAFAVKNSGTGTINVIPNGGDTIDTLSSIALSINESCIIVCDGTFGYYTVGRGRASSFNFTKLVKTLTGGTVTLSATEAANKLMQFQGTLGSNAIVVVPSATNIYYISNELTLAGYTLTVKTSGAAGVEVPTGRAILWCDSTNVYNAVTTTPSTIVSFIAGTAAAPSITFAGATSNGFFLYGVNTPAVSANGAVKVRFAPAQMTMDVPIAFTNAADATTTRNNLGAATVAQAVLYALVLS